MQGHTLVLGIGNRLLTDEAVGLEVVRRLSEEHGDLPNVRFLDGGTLSFTLAGPIAEAKRLIVVDAARMGTAPGTVRIFDGPAMDRQLSGNVSSVHEVSLADLLDIAKLTESLPLLRCLVGIEPATVDWGDTLTGRVQEAVPQAMTEVLTMIARWNGGNAVPE
ncbi:MAG: HyaD/HybD family hydrogenase maturation endopeptidase [Pseudomonadota bacterium]|nr:HyaD/HybD family hydrogenase maturation endopeptidase [Pseudomonadota bacterium]